MDLQTGLTQLSVTASISQIESLQHYMGLLLRWNRVYNLISKDTEADIIALHILDSLSVNPYLKGPRIIDVGSGAGLPGIPLAIMNPSYQFTLLDSNGKRTRFLTQCVIDLALTNIEIINERAEDYTPKTLFNSVVTRAFAEGKEAARATQHLLKTGGYLLAMHGLAPKSQDFSNVFSCNQVIVLAVPGLPAKRHLVELIKKEQ